MKKYLKLFIPPIIFIIGTKILRKSKQNKLFDGQIALFKKYLVKAKIYGEYGMGESTIYVNNQFSIPIISVDTNDKWKDIVYNNILKKHPQSIMEAIDLGVIASNYGDPIDYSKRDNIKNYINFLWIHDYKPDLVLIDGRFRVACFLNSYIHAKAGSVIIFDDYSLRPKYHIIEELLKPYEASIRQAIFIVPDQKNIDFAQSLLNKFEYVML